MRGPDDGIVMIRPEHLALTTGSGEIACRVRRIQLLGGLIRYGVEADCSPLPILVETTRPLRAIAEGSAAWLTVPAADAILYHR